MEVLILIFAILMSMPDFWTREFWAPAIEYANSCIHWLLANSLLSSMVALGMIAIIITCSVVCRLQMMVDLKLDKQ